MSKDFKILYFFVPRIFALNFVNGIRLQKQAQNLLFDAVTVKNCFDCISEVMASYAQIVMGSAHIS